MMSRFCHSGADCRTGAVIAIIASNATLTIRRLDERTKAKLSVRAAQSGRSMEGDARSILRRALERELTEDVDGYKVVFALAAPDPDFSDRQIILADKRNGEPLDDQ